MCENVNQLKKKKNTYNGCINPVKIFVNRHLILETI